MLLGETLRVALQSILGNLFRAILTMLGIVIGVGAVITMVALGTGAQQAIDQQMEAFGGNILSVNTSSRFTRGVAMEFVSLTTDDALALARGSDLFDGVVPELSSRFQVKYGNQNLNVSVLGTTANYVDVHGFTLAHGRMFSNADDTGRRRVAVLGAEIPEMLELPAESLVGQTVQIRSINFDVIGVLEAKGSSGFSNPDDDVWIPLSTAQF
ncbi:MAG: ABC transporter permease, partial [Pseudomonadota bacterium]